APAQRRKVHLLTRPECWPTGNETASGGRSGRSLTPSAERGRSPPAARGKAKALWKTAMSSGLTTRCEPGRFAVRHRAERGRSPPAVPARSTSLDRGGVENSRLLSTPFHKYGHVCDEGFLAQTRRERRAYPSGVWKE